MKYELFIDYLNKLNGDDIVCFIDAYDVLPTKNIINLETEFISFSQKHPKIKMIVCYEKVDNVMLEYIEKKCLVQSMVIE